MSNDHQSPPATHDYAALARELENEASTGRISTQTSTIVSLSTVTKVVSALFAVSESGTPDPNAAGHTRESIIEECAQHAFRLPVYRMCAADVATAIRALKYAAPRAAEVPGPGTVNEQARPAASAPVTETAPRAPGYSGDGPSFKKGI